MTMDGHRSECPAKHRHRTNQRTKRTKTTQRQLNVNAKTTKETKEEIHTTHFDQQQIAEPRERQQHQQ